MEEEILKEMAQAISSSLHLDIAAVLCILKDYWQDKVSQVWRVEQMFEAAHRTQKPITREGAIEVLEWVFDNVDSEMGISWINIDAFLAKYHLDFNGLSPEQYSEVHGVFCVWRKFDPFNHQFGFFPGKTKGNLPEALAFAKKLAREVPGVPVYIACELYASEEMEPWVSVLVEEPGNEPIIAEGEISCTPSNPNNTFAS